MIDNINAQYNGLTLHLLASFPGLKIQLYFKEDSAVQPGGPGKGGGRGGGEGNLET